MTMNKYRTKLCRTDYVPFELPSASLGSVPAPRPRSTAYRTASDPIIKYRKQTASGSGIVGTNHLEEYPRFVLENAVAIHDKRVRWRVSDHLVCSQLRAHGVQRLCLALDPGLLDRFQAHSLIVAKILGRHSTSISS